MPVRLDSRAPGFARDFPALLARRRGAAEDVREAVTETIAGIADRGDAALLEFTRRFDRFDVREAADLRVGAGEIARAAAACEDDILEALRLAAGRIRAFHERQLPQDGRYTDAEEVTLGHRWTPVDAAGLYVPGGLASYPSSVLMNAIPAKVAGVPRLVMAVPAPGGRLAPLVLAAAELAGVDEVWRIGGAQAIAALALGTGTIRPVDKIVGPGNAYVAEAKRQVFGRVGIDSIAGPSEILVVADAGCNPEWIAADLLAQAEHGEDAQAILITDDEAFANAVEAALKAALAALERAEIAAASWRGHGAIILVEDLAEEAPALVDAIAPEHLELAIDDPEVLLARIRHAGAVFLGRYTPEAIGDYVAGPNHVLPTARTARFSSGLSVLDFMKRTSIVGCTAASLRRIGPAAVRLAGAEGLGAHARSVAVRLSE